MSGTRQVKSRNSQPVITSDGSTIPVGQTSVTAANVDLTEVTVGDAVFYIINSVQEGDWSHGAGARSMSRSLHV